MAVVNSQPVCVPPDRPPNEAARLEAVRTTTLLHPQAALKLHELTARVKSLLRVDYAAVNLVRSDDQRIVAATELHSGGGGSRDASFCGHAILTPHELTVVPDTWVDPRFRQSPYVLGPPFIRFYAAAPILAPGGEALGALCVFDSRPRERLSDHAREVLRDAAHAAERLR